MDSANSGSSRPATSASSGAETAPSNFIVSRIEEDLQNGTYQGRVQTRFPPEPNGYLHIGHAKSICLNFGLAKRFPGGKCNLRFDDTNPTREEQEYVDAIQADIRWLGFEWDGLYYASDYFDQLHAWAIQLIREGHAYVCHQTQDEMRSHRGTLTEPGKPSPYRDRSVEENLDLFLRMTRGEFPEGHCTLRAKIDMASPNFLMRDPVIYRILHAEHHRTGKKWCVYPMYDYAHGQSDSIEGVTHSICTLEFENHRPLYEWLIETLGIYRPQQIEFARLNITYMVMSKRKMLQLVTGNHVAGWDDPRMPTIAGFRRRGYTPASIRDFAEKVGIARVNSTVDLALLESCIRDDLNNTAPRALAVLRPLKLVITNYPEGQVEYFEAANHPSRPELGTRQVPFSREIYIEQDDFREVPPPKYFRLVPGKEVRLRFAYIIRCESVVKNDAGEITEVHCSYDPATRGGNTPDGRKIKGTIHWVSAQGGARAEVRLYDTLFAVSNPGEREGVDFLDELNPKSLEVLPDAWIEPSLAGAAAGQGFQFERLGYFCADLKDHCADKPVFNRTVGLRDSWAKQEG